ncbi:MAG: polysaccharide pyruvyl transferase family protein [Olsenella sp.]|jgi:coenzyme F420-reducing hydrogenase beta subunit
MPKRAVTGVGMELGSDDSAKGVVAKKIALMTWYSYHNYGTALQVAALFHVVSGLGHDIEVVDYHPTGKIVARPQWEGSASALGRLAVKGVSRLRQRDYAPVARERKFEEFLKDNLRFTESCPTMSELEALNERYDTFMCGSDQIWAPNVFDPHYFLDFAGDDRLKVAYAPSVGLPHVNDKDVARRMACLCGRFDALSTREESGSEIVSELTGRAVATVIDPTLLVAPTEWRRMAAGANVAGDGPYLLAYMLGHDEAHWRRIYALAKRLGLPVWVVPVFERDLRREGCIEEPIGPREFVSLIDNATYVCTDSFHGIAFSINLERDFCAFERFRRDDAGSQNSRVYNILDKLGLRGRLVSEDVTDEMLCERVQWSGPNAKLVEERNRSLSWLERALAMEPKSPVHKDNVLHDRSLCCGCTACACVCPVGAIEVSLDVEGFWRAEVDEGVCVSCGKCRKVCPFIEHSGSLPIEKGMLYSYKGADMAQLLVSSSGGAGNAISRAALDAGAAVLGCAFDTTEGGAVCRLVAPDDAEGLASLAGSKYMQSHVGSALMEAACYEGPLLVTGTPCLVAAARNLFGERDDVTYVDLICHGVPTRLLYDRYREWLSIEYGIDPKVAHTVFRYKPKGWREKFIHTSDGTHDVCLHQRHDPYLLIFEAGQCYADCCYECPWRAASMADVRLGDYWGPRYKKDSTGVSMLLALTERGHELVRDLERTGLVEEMPLSDYMDYQQTENSATPVFRNEVLTELSNSEYGIQRVCDKFAEPVAKQCDLYQMLEPLSDVAKRLLGRR